MPEQDDNLDLKEFQDKVLAEIKLLSSMIDMNAGFRPRSPKADAKKQAGINQMFDLIGQNISAWLGQMALRSLNKNKKVDEHTARARAFLKAPETKRLLCDRLRGVEDNLSRLGVREIERDAAEIATSLMPLLLPLARARSISLKSDPMAFALSAWIIARTGIKNYCAGINETEPLSL